MCMATLLSTVLVESCWVICYPLFKQSTRTNFDGVALSRGERKSYDAVKGEWKEIKRRPRLRWLDNIDRHQKGKNTFLKEVLRTKCFENRQDWRTLISRSTDSNSGEYP